VRSHAEGDVLCCFNLGNTPAHLTLPQDSQPLDGHGMSAMLEGRTLHLPAFGGYFGRV